MDPDFWISLAVCVGLVGAALWLLRVHWQHWQEVDADTSLTPRERDHLRRRHRRRMQTSTMLGFVGIAILAGRLFPLDEPTLAAVLYWLGVVLLVCWMALLALADILATRVHYGAMRRKVDSERDKLEAQLQRIQKEDRESEKREETSPEGERNDSSGGSK